jgi:hypothetical protein
LTSEQEAHAEVEHADQDQLSAAALCATWLLAEARGGQQGFVRRRIDRDNFHGIRYELARWLDADVEPGARLGAFNSGELGYFSGRSVTNLDGLVNSYDYFLYRRGGGEVATYLVEDGIDYFVDYASDPEIDGVTELVRAVSLPKVGPLEVRRVLRDEARGR